MGERLILRDGRELLVRAPTPDDAPMMHAYKIAINRDAPYIGSTPSELKDEGALRAILEDLASRRVVHNEIVIDETQGVMAADCFALVGKRWKESHVATVGVGLLAAYQGQGLGRALMERCIAWARAEQSVRKLQLSMFADNTPARRLYESLGFEHEGVRPRAFRQPDGSYHDDVLMGLWVGDTSI